MWVRHLVLNCSAAALLPQVTEIVGRPQGTDGYAVRYRPVEAARALLGELIGLYRAGQRRPLPLFERSSWAYAAVLEKTGDRDKALAKAEKEFAKSGRGAFADCTDDYVAQVYGDQAPFVTSGTSSPATVARGRSPARSARQSSSPVELNAKTRLSPRR